MNQKTLITIAVVAVAGVAVWYFWQQYKKNNAPATVPTTPGPVPPTNDSGGQFSGYVEDVTNAWNGLQNLWNQNRV